MPGHLMYARRLFLRPTRDRLPTEATPDTDLAAPTTTALTTSSVSRGSSVAMTTEGGVEYRARPGVPLIGYGTSLTSPLFFFNSLYSLYFCVSHTHYPSKWKYPLYFSFDFDLLFSISLFYLPFFPHHLSLPRTSALLDFSLILSTCLSPILLVSLIFYTLHVLDRRENSKKTCYLYLAHALNHSR